MSNERTYSVMVPNDQAEHVASLQRSAAAALERHRRAPIGDQTEALRLAHLQAQLDDIAYKLLDTQRGQPGAGDMSNLELTVVWPFEIGATPMAAQLDGEVKSRDVWRPSSPNVGRRAAVRERFEQQFERWIDPSSSDPDPICPSDVQNSVLSEGLRRYVADNGRDGSVEARVVYRDGSEARSFPLRSLRLSDRNPPATADVLRLTLLSVRHMEMDADVDGAWLRNREISLARPAGQTDELVYQQSCQQLAALSRDRPIVIEMFQTGLEPAVMGFYRAVAHHNIYQRGASVHVIPKYYVKGSDFAPGTIWTVV